MLKIDFLIICENAFITSGSNNLNVIGIFDVINTPGFPAVHPAFTVVAKIINDDSSEHEVSLKIFKEGLVLFQSPKIKFTDKQYQFINNMVNFQFPEEGKYTVSVQIDGEDKETRTINLNKINI